MIPRFRKGGRGFVGEEHPQWKGDKAGYRAVHIWLIKNYGKADRCENKNCKYPKWIYRKKGRLGYTDNPKQGDTKYRLIEKPSRFEWSLIKGRYTHKRDNFVMLCPHCHRKHDLGLLEIKL